MPPFRFPVLPIVGLSFALAGLPTVLADSPLKPEALRCEYLTNPIGIDEAAPRLSWELRGGGRGQRQSAYRVLVSSSPRGLREGRAELWDSGRVSSDQSAHVVYDGRPLGKGARAYWSVRTWDGEGRQSGYSRPAFWEMGLLRPADWTAKWIGLDVPALQVSAFDLKGAPWIWYPEGNPRLDAPLGRRFFRRTLTLPAGRTIVRAEALVSVDNEFVLYVNGKDAGRGGGWGSGMRVDLAPHLAAGANVLAVAGNNAGGPAGLMGRVRVEFDQGEPLILDIDASWKAAEREHPGWLTPAFDDSAWPAARVIGRYGDPPWGSPAAAGPVQGGPPPYLRKEFEVRKPVRRARAYMSALGVYELRLNGRRVGDDILAPGWTDYRKRVQYRTYDITPLLVRGPNAVGAILGDGWFAGSLGFDLSRNHFGPGPARVRVQLDMEYADGSRGSVGSDETWRGAVGPILESDIYAGEIYDARKELPKWDRPGGGGADWRPVRVLTDRTPQLDGQMDPPIRVTQELPTRAVTQPRPGAYVFDLGQNMVGWARLRVRGPAGTRVTLRFAEVLNKDGTVYRDNLRLARATDVYVLSGRGSEVFEPHFTYHGFRYVEVTGYPGSPEPDAITGRVFHSSMRPTSRFDTSNELVNRLYQNITWGQRGNMMSVPTDCPQRDERLGWMGDAQLFATSSCWIMDMAPFYTKWMRDIVDAQSAAGGFSDVAPRVVDLAEGAPAWADAGLVVPWTVYQRYGDTRILERNFDAMKRYVDLIHSANPNLLWLQRRNNDFGDWVPAGEQTNKDLIAGAYFAYDARLLSRMARAIGRSADAEKYGRLADRITDAFNAAYLSPDGRYRGDTQTAYAMTLGMDLVPDSRRAQVAERLAETVRRRGIRLSTGFIGTAFLLPALSDTGQDELAYHLLTTTRYPSWGYMVRNGATTIWELWNSDTEGPAMNSRNHFAFGTVAEWMQRYLAGIDTDPAAPGYKRIIIRPHIRTGPWGLTEVRGEYDSQYGTIVSGWRLSPNGFVLNVRLPANTSATVHLPAGASTSIQERGRLVWSEGRFQSGVSGITAATRESAAVAISIGSGSYEFTVEAPGKL